MIARYIWVMELTSDSTKYIGYMVRNTLAMELTSDSLGRVFRGLFGVAVYDAGAFVLVLAGQ